jgi:hypothetical protein
MAEKENQISKEIFWIIPADKEQQRGKNWYLLAGAILLTLLIFSFLTKNLLFAFILIVSSAIIIMNDGKKSENIKIILNGDGVAVGRQFYDYDAIENFSILYKPNEKVKNIYCEFKNTFRQRLSLPLENMNPLQIREFLLQYLPEDLERIHPPLSEQLARIFKL